MPRPYPLTVRVVAPAVALVALVRGYFVPAAVTRECPQHTPKLALDRCPPVQPAWVLAYLTRLVSQFLPIRMIRQEELVRRALLAWPMVWIAGFVCFPVCPTTLPRPHLDLGNRFFDWCCRALTKPIRNATASRPSMSRCLLWRRWRGRARSEELWQIGPPVYS